MTTKTTPEQIMEQAQVFASAWSLVGSRFDSGGELDNANEQKDCLKQMVEALTAERDSAIVAAKYAEHIDATPENQLQTMLYDTLQERDAALKLAAERLVDAERDYLQPADLGDLMQFQDTTDDGEGYDIGKQSIKRLADLGAVQSHGFGRYSMTAFGHFALERMFEQSPALPLMTNDDRDDVARQAAKDAS